MTYRTHAPPRERVLSIDSSCVGISEPSCKPVVAVNHDMQCGNFRLHYRMSPTDECGRYTCCAPQHFVMLAQLPYCGSLSMKPTPRASTAGS